MGAAPALATVTCDECKEAVDGLVTRLTSEASIEEQIGILVASLCPNSPDPEGCEEAWKTWWGEIANVMFPVFMESTKVCTELGICKILRDVRDWTCEDCTNGINRIAEVIKDPATIADIVAFLQGDAFCGKHTDQANCPSDIEAYIPLAMPVLANVMAETAEELCQDIVGVC